MRSPGVIFGSLLTQELSGGTHSGLKTICQILRLLMSIGKSFRPTPISYVLTSSPFCHRHIWNAGTLTVILMLGSPTWNEACHIVPPVISSDKADLSVGSGAEGF